MKSTRNQSQKSQPRKRFVIYLAEFAAIILLGFAGYLIYNGYLAWQDRQNMEQINKTIIGLQENLQATSTTTEWGIERHCVQPEEKYRKLQLFCVIATESYTQVADYEELKSTINDYQTVLRLSGDLIAVSKNKGKTELYPEPLRKPSNVQPSRYSLEEDGHSSFKLANSEPRENNRQNRCRVVYEVARERPQAESIKLHTSVQCIFDAAESYFPITEKP